MANQPFPAPKEAVFGLSICCSLEWRILYFFLNEFSQAVPIQQIQEERAAVPLGQTMASPSVLLQEKAECSLPMAIE